MVAQAIGVVLGIVVARLLGPEGTGAYNVVGSFLIILAAAGTLGLGSSVLHGVGRGTWVAGEALRQTSVAAVALGTAMAVAGLLLALGPASPAFDDIPRAALVIGLVALPFMLWWNFGTQVAIAADRAEAFAAALAGSSLISLVLTAAIAPAAGVTGAVLALMLAHTTVALGLAGWGRRTFPVARGWLHRTRERLDEALRFGVRAYVPSALQQLNFRADLLILSAFAAEAEVGEYSIALSLSLVAALVPRSIARVLPPRVAALDSAADEAEQRMVIVKSARHGLMQAGIVCAGMAAVLPLVPLVYGSGFSDAILPGFLLIPAAAGSAMWGIFEAILIGKGRPEYTMWTALIATGVALGLYVALIPQFDAVGAAVASSVSQLAGAVIALHYFRRVRSGLPLSELLPRRIDVSDYRDLARRALRRARGW
jgi:O-antigen/teichoic acid export membrane protein